MRLMTKMTKYLQVLTCALIFSLMSSCGAVKVVPVEEGDSLRYHARVGYFLHPPQRIKSNYIKHLDRYSKNSEFVRCEPSSIVRIHERFERRYVEIKQGDNIFLFDTIAGKPIELINGKYVLIDKYFKKNFPLPTGVVRRRGRRDKKSNLICQNKVWEGMSAAEYLITRPPPENIIVKNKGKSRIEKWQYETKNHILKEYLFEDGILQSHSDN